ncbi:MAG: hypothetical protein MHPSP_000998, partial [Paramarteilia canceri]
MDMNDQLQSDEMLIEFWTTASELMTKDIIVKNLSDNCLRIVIKSSYNESFYISAPSGFTDCLAPYGSDSKHCE